MDRKVTGLSGICTSPRPVIRYVGSGQVCGQFSLLLTVRAAGGQPGPAVPAVFRTVPSGRTAPA